MVLRILIAKLECLIITFFVISSVKCVCNFLIHTMKSEQKSGLSSLLCLGFFSGWGVCVCLLLGVRGGVHSSAVHELKCLTFPLENKAL